MDNENEMMETQPEVSEDTELGDAPPELPEEEEEQPQFATQLEYCDGAELVTLLTWFPNQKAAEEKCADERPVHGKGAGKKSRKLKNQRDGKQLGKLKMSYGVNGKLDVSYQTATGKDNRTAYTPGSKRTEKRIAKKIQAAENSYKHACQTMIFKLPKEKGFSPETFESGSKGWMKDLLQGGKSLDVVILTSPLKKRYAAPTPELFSKSAQGFVSKRQGSEGHDQQAIIETTNIYTQIFDKVMGLSRDQYSPSLDGGLDAVVELLDDVRTSAWNMAAFIFKRR